MTDKIEVLPPLPKPFMRHWVNAPFEDVELFTAEQMHDHARAALAQRQQVPLIEWAVQRWKDEVSNRPLINKNRRTLDDTWRQVIRFAGGAPDSLLGPSHDELLAAAPALTAAPSAQAEPVAYVDHADGRVIWKGKRLPGGALLYAAPPAAQAEPQQRPASKQLL